MPDPRPPSPFLILLLGVAATALAAEWLRFQWSWAAAVPPALAGTAGTIAGVARAYRRRRAWRRGRHTASEVPAPAPDRDDDADIHVTRPAAIAAPSTRPRREAPDPRPGRPPTAAPAAGPDAPSAAPDREVPARDAPTREEVP